MPLFDRISLETRTPPQPRVSLGTGISLKTLSRGGADAVLEAGIGLHQAMEWALLVMIGIHVASAMAHLFIYRDRVMQRMLPG